MADKAASKYLCWRVHCYSPIILQKQGDFIMNKTELIATMAEKTELTKVNTEKVLVAFMDTIKEELVKGEKVQIVGFGSFEVTERAARTGRNPKTGESISIDASKTPKFKAGKAFKDAIKNA